jgi:hypothetical protein
VLAKIRTMMVDEIAFFFILEISVYFTSFIIKPLLVMYYYYIIYILNSKTVY